ncbi:MAG TPA: hypothetical protein VM600_02290, partial [Actinomycetota bacterium]|nr:hypothetical protein [Actinomycetota bacterium]
QRGGPAPPFGPALLALSASGRNDVWAAGIKSEELSDHELVERFLVMRYDGKAWREQQVPHPGDGTAVITDAYTPDRSQTFFAGYAIAAGAPDVSATLLARACLP